MKKIYPAFLFIFFIVLTLSAKAQWQQSNGPLGTEFIYRFATDGNRIFAGAYSGLLFSSPDNGEHWKNSGFVDFNVPVACIAVSNNAIYSSTYFGGISLSTDNGLTWEDIGLRYHDLYRRDPVLWFCHLCSFQFWRNAGSWHIDFYHTVGIYGFQFIGSAIHTFIFRKTSGYPAIYTASYASHA